MADIIILAERRNDTTRKPLKEPVQARILLFTGVRYERIQPLSKPRSTGPKGSKNGPSKRAKA